MTFLSRTRFLPSITAVDLFNDSDFSEYDNATDMSQSTSTYQEGGSAVKFTSGSPNLSISQNGDGLDNYIQQGDTWRGWARTNDANGVAGYLYGVQDSSNHFRAVLRATDNSIVIFKKASSNNQVIDIDTTINADTWYEIELTWDDGNQGGSQGDHTIDVFDVNGNSIDNALPATGNDTEFANQDGVGILSANAGSSFQDKWRVV